MTFSLHEVTLPPVLDAPDADDFLAYLAVRNAVEAEVLGTGLLTPDAAELLPEFRSSSTRRRVHLAATVDGLTVGRAMITTRPHTPGAGAYLTVDVLPEHRRRGIGAALADASEAAAAAVGETVLKVSREHSASVPGPRLAAPTGFGEVPEADAGVQLLLRRGYVLEQVVRISLLDTAGLAERLDALQSSTGGVDDGYRLLAWEGPTPREWLDDVAHLRSRMSVDVPMAGLQAEPDPWDAERVAEHDERVASAGRVVLTAVAEHRPSGTLAGYSEIAVSPGRPAATQEDTLVVREHRGHRLGLHLKIAAARHLLASFPHVEAVATWNAEENRPMLDVNEAMGFRPIGLEGGWQRRLPETVPTEWSGSAPR
jgi:GNAT superfamily N-acetyltransferase